MAIKMNRLHFQAVFKFINNILRWYNSDLSAKTEYPSVELFACHNINRYTECCVAFAVTKISLPNLSTITPMQSLSTDSLTVAFHRRTLRKRPLNNLQDQIFQRSFPVTLIVKHLDIVHFVNTVMLYTVGTGVIGNEIVILIIPAQRPRWSRIRCPWFFHAWQFAPFPKNRVPNGSIWTRFCGWVLLHSEFCQPNNKFVHSLFWLCLRQNLPLQFLAVVNTCKPFKLMNEGNALFSVMNFELWIASTRSFNSGSSNSLLAT